MFFNLFLSVDRFLQYKLYLFSRFLFSFYHHILKLISTTKLITKNMSIIVHQIMNVKITKNCFFYTRVEKFNTYIST